MHFFELCFVLYDFIGISLSFQPSLFLTNMELYESLTKEQDVTLVQTMRSD